MEINEKTIEARMRKKATQIWGKDRFQLTSQGAGRGFVLVVFYDKIIVKNGTGKSHTVREVYARICFNSHGSLSSRVCALRTAATAKEVAYGYLHSHPGAGVNVFTFNQLCSGSGPMSQLMGVPFSEESFQAIAIALEAFLSWEGAGYNYLGSVTERSKIADKKPLLAKDILKLLKQIPDLKSLVKVHTDFKVIPSKELEIVLGKLTESNILKDESGTYFTKKVKKEGISESLDTGMRNVPTKPVIVFNGVEKYATLLNSSEDREEELVYYAHPVVTQSVCKYLTRKLKRNATQKKNNEKTPKKYGSRKNAATSTKPGRRKANTRSAG